jgi:hypothetical protein
MSFAGECPCICVNTSSDSPWRWLSCPRWPPTAPAPIVDGVVDGSSVSFALTMAIIQGMPPVLISYSGRVQGDELTLAATVDMGQGPIVTPVVARRGK